MATRPRSPKGRKPGRALETKPPQGENKTAPATIGRPRMYKTAEQMQAVIDEYFEEHKGRLTIGGLALALGLDRDTLLKYEGREPFVGILKRAKERIVTAVEELLLFANTTPVGRIFWLKNNGNYRDSQDVKVDAYVEVVMPGRIRKGDKR